MAVFFVGSEVYAQSSSQLQKERTEQQKEIQRLEEEKKQKAAEERVLSSDLKNIETDISATERKIQETESLIGTAQKDVEAITAEITQKENDLAVHYKNQQETLRTLYETTEDELLITYFSESISEMVDRSSYLEALQINIESTIEDVQALRGDLVGRKEELVKKQQQMEDLRRQQQAYRSGLSHQQSEKSVLLDETQEAKDSLAQKITESKKKIQQIESQISALARASAKSGGAIRSKDKGTSNLGFVWPMDYRYISTNYGPTGSSYPFYPQWSFHYGLDLVNVCGTPIYASADGIANLFSTSYGYGNYIIVGHNARFSTLYGHMQGFAVSNGQEVSRGQVIGYEGTTGSSTGCHLHFEIWDNGARNNPHSYLP